MKAVFILILLSSLCYPFYMLHKEMSFSDKMFFWETVRNFVAITFFCTIGVDLYFHFMK